MIEQAAWDLVKSVAYWLWVPLGAVVAYVFKDYTHHKAKTIELEHRVVRLEVQYSDMKEDLTDIKEGVSKLVDHLLDNKK